jgi:tetratricopeptide (TPR) repeat protein
MNINRNLHIFIAFFCLLSLLPLSADAQHETPTDSLLSKADEQIAAFDEKGAIETYKEVLSNDPDNFEALWNISVLHSTVGYRQEKEEIQETYYNEALNYAEKALEYHPDKGLSYYAMAVAKGRIAEIQGTREKIRLSHEVQKYISKAVDMLPEHALSWHLYGVWQSEVANVGRAQRFAANFVSEGIPDASNDLAEKYLKRARDLSPGNVLISYDLAKHYVRSGQEGKAIPVLEELITMEPKLKDGKRHIGEAKELLNDLKS